MNLAWTAIWVSFVLFAAMLAFMEIGYRTGRKRRSRFPQDSHEGVGTVGGAILGLLGLALAFAFGAASERFVLRREQVIQEANAISTAYARVDLLPKPEQRVIRDLFRHYLESRIEVFDKLPHRAASDAALARSTDLQHQIWSRVVAAYRNGPATSILLIPALNNMFDIANTRAVAARTHVPAIVIVLLAILSLLGAMLSGYAMSVQANRNPLHFVLFALAIAATVYVILDLEDPRAGMINLRSADWAMIRVGESMK